MRQHALTCSGIRISIEEMMVDAAVAILPQPDGQRLHLGQRAESVITAFRVSASISGRTLWQLVLSTDDGLSTVHPKMAHCLGHRLFVGIGPHVVCLDNLSGQVQWVQRADSATVFAIHPIVGEEALLIHGEMEITKLALDGIIVWQAGGRDTFTSPFILKGDYVRPPTSTAIVTPFD